MSASPDSKSRLHSMPLLASRLVSRDNQRYGISSKTHKGQGPNNRIASAANRVTDHIVRMYGPPAVCRAHRRRKRSSSVTAKPKQNNPLKPGQYEDIFAQRLRY